MNLKGQHQREQPSVMPHRSITAGQMTCTQCGSRLILRKYTVKERDLETKAVIDVRHGEYLKCRKCGQTYAIEGDAEYTR